MMLGAVAPFTGAWIETYKALLALEQQQWVAPFTGAWIETTRYGYLNGSCSRRALHGRVD